MVPINMAISDFQEEKKSADINLQAEEEQWYFFMSATNINQIMNHFLCLPRT